MRADAEAHAEEDKKKVAEIEARNILDNRVYQVEKLIADNREKLPESDTKPVEEAVAAAKTALSSGSVDQIQSATQKLEAASHKLAEVLYKSAQAAGAQAGAGGAGGGSTDAGPGAPQGGPGQGKEGDVIDAEYVDVDETKKPNYPGCGAHAARAQVNGVLQRLKKASADGRALARLGVCPCEMRNPRAWKPAPRQCPHPRSER